MRFIGYLFPAQLRKSIASKRISGAIETRAICLGQFMESEKPELVANEMVMTKTLIQKARIREVRTLGR